MTPHQFAQKWKASQLKERSAVQEYFLENFPFPEGFEEILACSLRLVRSGQDSA